MASNLKFSGQSGLTVYAVIRNLSDHIWNGSAFVPFAGGDFATYDVPLTEQETSGYYHAAFPSGLDAGAYHVTYHAQFGGAPAQTDDVVYQTAIEWDGTEVVDDLATGGSILVTTASIADICNMALAHLGHGKQIASLTADTTEEASACRTFYDTALLATQRDFPWSFCRRISALPLVEEEPNDEWKYSYRYPVNTLRIIRILSGSRNDTRQSRIPYRIISDDYGRLLLTDVSDAEIEHTVKVSNPVRFTPDFVLAFSLRLAHYVAPRITNGDKARLGERALALYAVEIQNVMMSAANEEQVEEAPESEFILARG